MRIKTFIMMLFILTLVTVTGTDVFAAIYKYVDKDGMVYFADDLQSIPAQYRSTAKIVSGEIKEETEQRSQAQQVSSGEGKSPETSVPIAQQRPLAEHEAANSFAHRATVSVIIVVSALFAFVILRILDADHKKSIAIIRVAIVWGVFVFLLYAHTGDVITAFNSIGGTIDITRQQAEEKGKKAAKAVKTLDKLIERVENAPPSDPAKSELEKKEER
jgi:hypothetical protein